MLLFLSILFFLLLDIIIFRSGAYAFILNENTTAGQIFRKVHFEKNHLNQDGNNPILILGASEMQFAFSNKIFTEKYANEKFDVRTIFSPGLHLQVWYYLLKFIDQDKNKYEAIVIPISRYKPNGSSEHNHSNRIDTAQFLSPFISVFDWYELFNSFNDKSAKEKILRFAFTPSHIYAKDIQDLLIHPLSRYEQIRFFYLNIQNYNPNIDINKVDDMKNFIYDSSINKITQYPAHFNNHMRNSADFLFQPISLESAYATSNSVNQYNKIWLNKIIDYYALSNTKIILFEIPFPELKRPSTFELKDALDLRNNLNSNPNLYFFDENFFQDQFNDPKYYYDWTHMNSEGQSLFTISLINNLITIRNSWK